MSTETEITVTELVELCGSRAYAAGWYTDYETVRDLIAATGNPKLAKFFQITYNASRLALVHSEVSEALEGVRKSKPDDHLPELTSEEVEIADTIIRLADYCFANRINLTRAIMMKLEYNARRPDHKLENRIKEGGKAI